MDIRQGLVLMTLVITGAFYDPYSHTPKGQGAKQPGMTGMVKEILARKAEAHRKRQAGLIHSVGPAELRPPRLSFHIWISMDASKKSGWKGLCIPIATPVIVYRKTSRISGPFSDGSPTIQGRCWIRKQPAYLPARWCGQR
jgi:hypothetical protein